MIDITSQGLVLMCLERQQKMVQEPGALQPTLETEGVTGSWLQLEPILASCFSHLKKAPAMRRNLYLSVFVALSNTQINILKTEMTKLHGSHGSHNQ